MSSWNRFNRGDYIEVRWVDGKYTGPDFGTVRGTALDTRGTTGLADFRVLVAGQEMGFNLNYVEVELLFSADIARGE